MDEAPFLSLRRSCWSKGGAICVAAILVGVGHPSKAGAAESLEFIAEHLPEVAMDNRFATLPLWQASRSESGGRWTQSLMAGYSATRVSSLEMKGPMLSLGLSRNIGVDWTVGGIGFFDTLDVSGGIERRPLDVLFVPSTPLDLPAEAEFHTVPASARHLGAGLWIGRSSAIRWLGSPEWKAGILWQELRLTDYAWHYRVLEGRSKGASGEVDYSAAYAHFTPFLGLAWSQDRGAWAFRSHVQIAVPLPRRGIIGQIRGSEFSLSGDTDTARRGKHFGDPSVTIGWDLTYRPWGLTVDLGSVLSQALVEPLIHEGVDRNWVLAVHWNR